MEQTTPENLLPIEELNKRMKTFAINYFLVDVHRDRESYYAAFPEFFDRTLQNNSPFQPKYNFTEEKFLCLGGAILNLIMDGELEKSWEIIDSIPTTGHYLFLRIGIILVHPKVTWKQFIDNINYLKKLGFSIANVLVTAGRPSVLNGFNDFSRIGPFLQRNRDLFLEDLACLYEKSICPAIYNQCLCEWLYQQNKLMDAEVILSRTIKEFNRDGENRLLFAAHFLQTKIFIAQGKSVHLDSFIKNMRLAVKELGHQEFSYNLNATEALCALYEGDTKKIISWFENDAPDEYSDFCMLDNWRYLVKIRFYIVVQNYSAAIALIEKIRPLLEEGKRHMDLCELDLLNAIALYRADKKNIAFKALFRSLKIAKRRHFYRIIADEGDAILPILNSYIKEKGMEPFGQDFFVEIVECARNISITYPLYLKPIKNQMQLTNIEIEILHFLERGKTTEEIADTFFISTNTVKFHLKKIYGKLDVKNATGAIWEARLQGIL